MDPPGNLPHRRLCATLYFKMCITYQEIVLRSVKYLVKVALLFLVLKVRIMESELLAFCTEHLQEFFLLKGRSLETLIL